MSSSAGLSSVDVKAEPGPDRPTRSILSLPDPAMTIDPSELFQAEPASGAVVSATPSPAGSPPLDESGNVTVMMRNIPFREAHQAVNFLYGLDHRWEHTNSYVTSFIPVFYS